MAIVNNSGVPPLLNAVSTVSAILLTADAIGGLLGLLGGASPWGIYLNGEAVVIADAVTAIEYKKDSHISDYPIEGGKFETYNKVAQPFDVRVTFIAGGSDSNRALFLSSVESIVDDYNLYSVITPEATYQNCNVVHHDYRRTTQNGRGIIAVTVWLKQVRVSTSSTSSTGASTAQPSGASAVIGGSPQAVTPTSAQSSAITAYPIG